MEVGVSSIPVSEVFLPIFVYIYVLILALYLVLLRRTC
jgi:hypothetical protein